MTNKYFGFMPNDFINGEGISVSLWVSGCPHRCPGCHNSHMWDFNSGYDIPNDIKGRIIKAISANGIQRNFSVLGGEPLCSENIEFVEEIVSCVRTAYPNIKIMIWTGYTEKELKRDCKKETHLKHVLEMADVLIDGKFEEDKRDTTLKLRGSSNQKIIDLHEKFWYNISKEKKEN